jgi:tetratricopeptide (TPR) repeat protein
MLYLNEGRLSEALQIQNRLVELEPNNVSYAINLALILSEKKEYRNAIEKFNEIYQKHGFIPKVSETLARIYFELEEYEKANEEIKYLVEIFPENPIYLLYESDLYFRKGQDSIGFQKIFQAIEVAQGSTYPFLELYSRQLEAGKIKESLVTLKSLFNNPAVTEYEKVQLFYPMLFEPYYYTALPTQLDSLSQILNNQYPSSIQVAEINFEHQIRRRNFENAKELLVKIIKLDKNNPNRWEKLISLEFALENYDAVLKLSERAMELFPSNHTFYILQAVAYQQFDKIQLAIDVLEVGAKNVNNNPEGLSDIYGTLGDYYYMKGDITSTFKAYSKSLQHNENNIRILNNYSYYLSLRKEKLSKALEMSTKAVNLDPNNSTYIDTKGWVLFQMERYSEARDVLRNAISKGGSSSAVINEHYGDALYKTGNIDSAYIYWMKAKELGGASQVLDEKIRSKKWVP